MSAVAAGVEAIHRERGRLFALAYRMLGRAGEAEDVVQEAFLRWFAEPRDGVRSPPAFLTTVVTRLCLDHLKSAQYRRELYPGVWLPEPVPDEAWEEILAEPRADGDDPQQRLQRLETVSLAFLTVLDTLTPLERAVYLLVDVFDYSHAEVGAMLERSAEACRQVLRRARQAMAQPQRTPASAERHRELLGGFLAATQAGDLDALTRLLADDVVSRADGGGRVTAANRPVVGLRAVSRLFVGLSKQMPPGLGGRLAMVNGWPAALLTLGDVLVSVVQVRSWGDRIERIDNVMAPAKLARVAAAHGLRVAGG